MIKRTKRINTAPSAIERAYQKLPPYIFTPFASGSVDESVVQQEGLQDVQEFLTSRTTKKDVMMFQSTVLLIKKAKKQKITGSNSQFNKPQFTFAEKRQLGIFLLPREGLKFENIVPLNILWKEYMMDFMNIEQLKDNGFKGTPQDKQWSEFSLQLIKADYHGAFMEVTRSKCASHVGVSGIVVMDTKNTYKLIGRDNIVRTIPKESSVFKLTLDVFTLTIFGKYMCIRPAERCVKKIKSRIAADL